MESEKNWNENFAEYKKEFLEKALQIEQMQHRELPEAWDAELAEFPADSKGVAGRDASAKVLNAIAKNHPFLIGGSAGLAPLTKTRLTFDGTTILKHSLSREICQQAFALTEQFGIGLWVYCDHDWHVDKITPFVEREQNTIRFQAKVEKDLTDAFGTAAKIVIVGDPAIVAEVELLALEKFGAEVSATKSKPRFLDITAKQAHKGTLVNEIAAILNIPTSEIAVIGDGLNDVLMFENAGFSIARGQAGDEVKAAASVVTKTNTEDGFAGAIEKYILTDHSS